VVSLAPDREIEENDTKGYNLQHLMKPKIEITTRSD